MTNLFADWVLIVAALVVIGMSFYVMWSFSRKPREEQIEQLKEWLLYAVTRAEQIYGSSTGQLKLRYVYDLFVQRFPALSNVISFAWFSKLVDDALEQMRGMLSTNKVIKAIVEGESV